MNSVSKNLTEDSDSPSPYENSGSQRLMAFAETHGERFAVGGNVPIRLDDPSVLWFVAQGSVDIFASREQDDGIMAEYKHLMRAARGQLLFPVDPAAFLLIAKGMPGSQLLRVSAEALLNADEDRVVAEQVDHWVSEFSASVADDVTARPHAEYFVTAGGSIELNQEAVVSTKQEVVWISRPEGRLAFLGTEDADPDGPGYVPVAPDSWVLISGANRIQGASSWELHDAGQLMLALAEFQRLALSAHELNSRLLLADAANLRTAQTKFRRESENAARQSLFNVLDVRKPSIVLDGSAMQSALMLVGRHEGIEFRAPPTRSIREPASRTAPTLDEILTVSSVRGREITLDRNERWWLGDSGAMLAFRIDDDEPVALLPGRFGRYRMVDPISGRVERVSAASASKLKPNAHFFCQALNAESTGHKDLARVAFRTWKSDVLRFMLAGLLAGLAMLVPAILLGVFVSEVLPTGRKQELLWLTAGVLLLAIIVGLLEVLKGTAMMRLEGRAAARITASLWDRLLDLPAYFFRNFTSGDLGARLMSFHTLRDQVSGVVAGSLLSSVFLLPTFLLLFIYNPTMGWLGLVLGLLMLFVTATLGIKQIPHHHRLFTAQRSVSGVLLQLISAAYKLRATGKEWTAFTRWAHGYREQKVGEMHVGAVNEHLIAFTAASPLLATAVLFATVAKIGTANLTEGEFIAIYAAYLVFMGSIAALGPSISVVSAVVPAMDQVTPILDTKPKSATREIAVPEIRGGLRLEKVSFRYAEGSPLILNNVSLEVKPGEFVALVGGSGSGKSTILRLLLGLERPTSGVVYYDGYDLDRLNRRALRKQVGVVMQEAKLRPRTVCDNIIGAALDLNVDDAWQAAHFAVVERDIRAMPMGMFTPVMENASAFSGGQIQRILLAAALVRNPRVLLLDEATSWLDNNTQAAVMKRIEELSVTRVVVAHRLSTIRKADHVYVIDNGSVVQHGSFSSLIETPGVFQDLARRQLA